MGYTTDFSGQFKLDKPLTAAQVAYLNKFTETRRMKRDAAITEKRGDPLRLAVGLPVGIEGEHFVGAGGDFGQEGVFGGFDDAKMLGILDGNSPPRSQPGLWCGWVPTEDGTGIEWNGDEKFYSYVEWLEYIIAHFLKPWGLVLSGAVTWQGESSDDMGKIIVKDNVVRGLRGRVRYD